MLDTNLRGAFLCLKYEAKAMLAGGHRGAIVNVGSVNCVVETEMHQRLRTVVGDEPFDAMTPRIHLRRVGRPDEIAQAIVFLCSDEASYIAGTTLTPDGGFTLTE